MLPIAERSKEPGRFAWLLSTVASPPESPDSVEFAKACEFALASWQVLPVIVDRLLAWGGPGPSTEEAKQKVLDRAISLNVLSRIQLRLFERVINLFQERGIPYSMLKGSAVRFSAYPDPKLRMGKDFDIAVPRRYLRAAEQSARDCGFMPAQWDDSKKRFHAADPTLRAMVEAQHYELGFLIRRQLASNLTPEEDAAIRRDLDSQFIWHLTDANQLACYISIDIHHGLSLEMNAETLIDESVTINSNGFTVRVPPPEWVLFHLIYKIYWEGVHNYGKGAYQYADLARLIPSTTASTFRRLVSILAQCRLEAAGYFVLRRLSQNLQLSLQPEVEDFLKQAAQPPLNREPLDVNDLGDMWPKIWGAR
jgi:Uncharacterised nucleotidyltransferase